MVKGESDLFFAVKTEQYGGLFIELKTETGKPTTEQKIYIEDMRQGGYCAEVTYSLDEAKKVINQYLN